MKLIQYKFLSCEINHGTEDAPNMESVFLDKTIRCSNAAFDSNYALAQQEAVGEITVEDISEPDIPPSQEEDTAAMLVDHEFRLTLLELGLTE